MRTRLRLLLDLHAMLVRVRDLEAENERLQALAERLAEAAARRLRLLIRASDVLELYCPNVELLDEIDAEIERMGRDCDDDTG